MTLLSSKVQAPFILINFKTYFEATGEKALKLAKLAEKVSLEAEVCIGVAPQYVDIPIIARDVSIPIFAQHIDPITPGRNTGHILAEAIREAGAVGTIINHSERRLKLAEIERVIDRARQTKLISLVCTSKPQLSSKIASFHPNMVAIEPPELIETGVSVSKAKPEAILKTLNNVKNVDPKIIVLCGAGIVKDDDVATALRLGAEGILVASGIVKAKNPYKTLINFAKAITKIQ